MNGDSLLKHSSLHLRLTVKFMGVLKVFRKTFKGTQEFSVTVISIRSNKNTVKNLKRVTRRRNRCRHRGGVITTEDKCCNNQYNILYRFFFGYSPRFFLCFLTHPY